MSGDKIKFDMLKLDKENAIVSKGWFDEDEMMQFESFDENGDEL